MVCVEEGEGLLLEDEENGVNQFEVLGQIIHLHRLARNMETSRGNPYIVQHHQLPGPTSIIVTNGIENTVSNKSGEELFNEEGQETTTNDGQVEIVNHEGAIENKWLTMLHQFSPAKDYNIVCDQSSCRLFQSGHWSNARDKFEVIGGVAEDGRVTLV